MGQKQKQTIARRTGSCWESPERLQVSLCAILNNHSLSRSFTYTLKMEESQRKERRKENKGNPCSCPLWVR